MKIIFVRHGDAANAKGKFHGQTDEPLTQKGRNQSEKTAEDLKNCGIDEICSSPLVRAKQTAGIISKKLDLPFETDKGLNAWDLGNYVGQPHEKFLQHIKYFILHPDHKVPGGESFSSFSKRFLDWLNEYKNSKGMLTVTHGRNILLAKAWDKAGRDGTKFDKNELLQNHDTTKHSGYAVLDDKGFKIIDKEAVPGGRS